MTSPTILCFSEDPELLAGLVERARMLDSGPDSTVGVVAFAGGPAPPPGATRIYRLVSPNLRVDSPENVAQALARVAAVVDPRLFLFSSTKRGREFAARLAGLVDGAVATGVSDLSLGADGVRLHREMLSGNAVGEELISGRLPIVALMPAAPSGASIAVSTPEIVEVPVDLPTPPTSVVGHQEKPAGGMRIESAERIVAVGRGLQKRDDLTLIEQLARSLGAVVGCTRPIAAESGWLGDDHWIGLTGHRVKPRLYIAVGISGAVQHLVGMRDSKVVVAINKDANAPIFAHADYRVAGDLYVVVPALLKQLSPT